MQSQAWATMDVMEDINPSNLCACRAMRYRSGEKAWINEAGLHCLSAAINT